MDTVPGDLRVIVEAYLQAGTQGKLSCLEIAIDTVEASLSNRCKTEEQEKEDATTMLPWAVYASRNFVQGMPQEIPETTFAGMLDLLFPFAMEVYETTTDIIETVKMMSIASVRMQSPVFDAIYTGDCFFQRCW